MISKKVLGPALTGTGAVGASGTLAWTLGLLEEEILDEVVEGKINAAEPDPKQQKNVPSNPADRADRADSEKQAKVTTQDRQVGGGSRPTGGPYASRTATKVSDTYFTGEGGASSADKKIFDSGSTLKVEWRMESIYVDAKKEGEVDFSWKCRLKPISLDGGINSRSDSKEFVRQTEKLKEALENEGHKKQFVANCSYTRLGNEQKSGDDSTIELEAEEISYNKYKFKETDGYFERIWTEDFRGIYRLSTDEEENIVKKVTSWNISWKKESETNGKVTVSLSGGGLSCSISGDYGKDLGSRAFKKDELEGILKLGRLNSGELEKKRYLIRNCKKNKEGIKGLKIKDLGGKQWDFDEASLEKISKGMYENPTET